MECDKYNQIQKDMREFVGGVMRAAEAMSSPVIIGIATISIDFTGLEPFAAITRIHAEQSKIPTVIHLDHCES